MLKKAAAVTAIAAGITLAGTPAFAVAGGEHDYGAPHAEYTQIIQDVYSENEQGVDATVSDQEDNNQYGLININDTNICHVQVLSEVIALIPIGANSDEYNCLDVEDEDVNLDASNENEASTGAGE